MANAVTGADGRGSRHTAHLVWPRPVVMRDVLGEDPLQVALASDQQGDC